METRNGRYAPLTRVVVADHFGNVIHRNCRVVSHDVDFINCEWYCLEFLDRRTGRGAALTKLIRASLIYLESWWEEQNIPEAGFGHGILRSPEEPLVGREHPEPSLIGDYPTDWGGAEGNTNDPRVPYFHVPCKVDHWGKKIIANEILVERFRIVYAYCGEMVVFFNYNTIPDHRANAVVRAKMAAVPSDYKYDVAPPTNHVSNVNRHRFDTFANGAVASMYWHCHHCKAPNLRGDSLFCSACRHFDRSSGAALSVADSTGQQNPAPHSIFDFGADRRYRGDMPIVH